MSASGEQLGEEARQRALQEIIAEEEQRLGAFVLPTALEQINAEWDAEIEAEKRRILSPTLQVEQNWNDVRWGTPKINEPRI